MSAQIARNGNTTRMRAAVRRMSVDLLVVCILSLSFSAVVAGQLDSGMPAPSGIAYAEVSFDGRLGIHWTPVKQASSYLLQAQQSGASHWQDIYLGEETQFVFEAEGLFRFRVLAALPFGLSVWRTGSSWALIYPEESPDHLFTDRFEDTGSRLPRFEFSLLAPGRSMPDRSVEVRWSVEQADSCVAISNELIGGWSGPMPMSGPMTVFIPSIAPLGKNLELAIECQNEHGAVESGRQIRVSGIPEMEIFEIVSPDTSGPINPGALVNVVWQSSEAELCIGASPHPEWDGSMPNHGDEWLTVSEEEKYLILLLECFNEFGSTGREEIMVPISPIDGPEECQGILTLEQASGGVLQRTDDVLRDRPANGYEYASVFGHSFPGLQQQQQFRLAPNTYAAMRFDAPHDLNSSHSGVWHSEVMLGAQTGRRLVSVSQCPGDFEPAHLDQRCIRSLAWTESFRWSGDSGGSRCPIEPGRQYYLNIIYSEDPAGTPPSQIQWSCGSASGCGNLVLPVHNY